jgi:hypothetical protein
MTTPPWERAAGITGAGWKSIINLRSHLPPARSSDSDCWCAQDTESKIVRALAGGRKGKGRVGIGILVVAGVVPAP